MFTATHKLGNINQKNNNCEKMGRVSHVPNISKTQSQLHPLESGVSPCDVFLSNLKKSDSFSFLYFILWD